MSRTAWLCLLVVAAACDTVPVGTSDGRYRTEGTDYPNAALLASDGSVVVGALVEGTIAPTDGTIGHPAVVRFAEGEARASIYRRDERTYSGVEGVAELGRGLAVAIGRDEDAAVYRADADGALDGVLFRLEGRAGFTRDALTRTSAGLVLAVFPYEATGPQLYGISPSGALQWTYRMAATQDVQAVSAVGDHLYALGSGSEGVSVARLTPDGEEVWRRVLPGGYGAGLAAADDGVVAVVREHVDERQRTHVVRLDADGAVLWEQTVGTDRDGGEVAVTTLADGGAAVGMASFPGDGFEGGTRTEVALLDAAGDVRGRLPVNDPGDDTTFVQSLFSRPDGSLVAVLAIGPKRLSGYGGDDFDIEVRTLTLGG